MVRFLHCVNRGSRTPARRHQPFSGRGGLTLVEILLTIAILGIIAAVVLPQLTSDIPERLTAAAQVVISDLEYARSLAVANNSKYKITFDPGQNRYYLQHSGTNAVLTTLPYSPFRLASDSADRQTTDLGRLPLPAPTVRLVAAARMQSGGQTTPDIEFTSLGNTTSTYETQIWLACGSGNNQRFLPVLVNPVTGLVTTGTLTTTLPSAIATIASMNAGGS